MAIPPPPYDGKYFLNFFLDIRPFFETWLVPPQVKKKILLHFCIIFNPYKKSKSMMEWT